MKIRLGDEVEHLLSQALEEATAFQANHIGSEHILVALTRDQGAAEAMLVKTSGQAIYETLRLRDLLYAAAFTDVAGSYTRNV